jgi:hypothetical protein
MKTGECKIDWENDRVIFVQVFRGHIQAGHWFLLIIDRTISKHGALIFFDSLPDYFPDTLSKLKSMLTGTPLAPEGCKWITHCNYDDRFFDHVSLHWQDAV